MANAVAVIGVNRKTLNTQLNGKDDTDTNDTDGFRKIAHILKEGGPKRSSKRPRCRPTWHR